MVGASVRHKVQLGLTRRRLLPDFHDNLLQELIASLGQDNFQSYLTAVGGSGVGILSPYEVHRRASDPSISLESSSSKNIPNGAASVDYLLKSEFDTVLHDEFAQWAESQGRWLYV